MNVLIWADNASNESDFEYNALYMKVTQTYIPSHQGNIVYDVYTCVHVYIHTYIYTYVDS
jgi:hypothetical protein